MISLDTETTGLDLRHGAKPFLVTICYENGEQEWWEWDVDPYTREPKIPLGDLNQIRRIVYRANSLVLQNPKFDVAALQSVFRGRLDWPWYKTYDTLLAGHLLESNHPHDLTTMTLMYLGVNVQPFEDAVKKATMECRRMCQGKHPEYDWRIANADEPDMPSAKASTWKYDMWLPRMVAKREEHAEDCPWLTVCSEYANSDSASTLQLFKAQRELLKERKLWRIYKERLKVLPIVYEMERVGVTLSKPRLDELTKEYLRESQAAAKTCYGIAKKRGKELELPKSGNNASLLSFVFGEVKEHPCSVCKGTGKRRKGQPKASRFIPYPVCVECAGSGHISVTEDGLVKPKKRSKKTGKPSLDKSVMDDYLSSLPEKGAAYRFLTALRAKRKRDTALNYMVGYEKFWLPLYVAETAPCEVVGWYKLHPSLNPTGTDTLRWSSSNPNEQNISKQEGFNLRYCFGPAPGREWWCLDAKNIELRIPAYEAGETEQIALFEKPDEAPFYGSNHLLVCSILHPKKFEECVRDGVSFKDRYKTLYGRTKNGNFAVQYGAVEASGTADRAYGVSGAQSRIQGRFRKIHELNKRMIAIANARGYVETMPDKTVDAKRGYPLLCSRSKWGKVVPTVPLNYHVQGTAMWWMMKAMIRCQEYLNEISAKEFHGKPYRANRHAYAMVMQVHDEIVFDFPKGRHPKSNLPKIRKIAKLMEEGGNDIGVPTPVSITYHADNWSEGVEV